MSHSTLFLSFRSSILFQDLTNEEKTFLIFVLTTTISSKSKTSVPRPSWLSRSWTNSLLSAFNLINEINIPQTEARIAAYRAENAALIELNVQREEAYARALQEQEEGERRERESRALELRREEEEEREEREKDRREIIDKLETSDKNASKLIAKSRANALKRSSARAVSTSVLQSNAKLLRSRAAYGTNVQDLPHVPLQDDWYAYEDKFEMRPGGYDDIFSEAVRKDREGVMRGGGYVVEEAWERALRCAVAALDLPPLVGLDHPSALPLGLDVNGDVIMQSIWQARFYHICPVSSYYNTFWLVTNFRPIRSRSVKGAVIGQ